MKDFKGNEVCVGDIVVYNNPGSKTLIIGEVTKINPKSVSILREGWQTLCSWQCKTLARASSQIYRIKDD